jgi:hypothetical protein
MNPGQDIDLNRTGSFSDFVNSGEISVNVKTSTVVKLYEVFTVVSDDGPVDLRVSISADFNEIPEKYHEIFLNMITSKYLNKVNFGSNPFSECRPVIKRKWWQFWQKEYFTQ